MKIPIQLEEGAKMPEYATDGSAGADLFVLDVEYYAISKTELMPIGAVVRTGVRIKIPYGYEAQIRPRSSITKKGGVIPVGTIDSDYRGEIKVIVHMFGHFSIGKGDRIAQLVIAPVVRADFDEFKVFDLFETERGSNGFGSTGK